MGHPVCGGVHVPVHHRGRGTQADPVRGGHHLDPARRGQLALRQHPADIVVEDLRRGAGDRVDAGLAGRGEPVANRHAGAGDAVENLHRRVGVQMQPRRLPLDLTGEIEVRGAR